MAENYIHRVSMLQLCCNVSYGVEFENATLALLFVPQCKCDYDKRRTIVKAVITNAFGKANVYKCKFDTLHFDSFQSVKLNDMLPSRLKDREWLENFPAKNHPTITKWWMVMSENFDDFNLNFNFKFAVLERPTENYLWITSCNLKFDSCTTSNLYFNQNCVETKRYEGEEHFKSFTAFESWVSKCDMNIWIWLDKNVNNFAYICQCQDACLCLIEMIENLNANTKTYYGHAVLMYVLERMRPRDWRFVEFYERNVVDKVRDAFKHDPDNVELQNWINFDGNVDEFKTIGLANTIKRTQFDAAYKWFCQNVKIPTIIDRGQLKCYCDAPIDCCLAKKQRSVSHKKAYINDVQYVIQNCSYKHDMLLTDAIMECASLNNGMFKLGDDNTPAGQIVIDVAKYPQLWRFVDLLNTYNYTGVELNMHANRCSSKGTYNSPCCIKERYIIENTFNNRYLQSTFFKFVGNLHDIFATFHSRCNSAEPMEKCFPKNFVEKYLHAHGATHVHVMRRDYVFQLIENANDADKNNVMIKKKIINTWNKNRNVFINDRQVCIVQIQRWFKKKIYNPDSVMVGKLKKRYENNYKILLRK
ncbi:hypothetical protein [Orgyia leucostigma nucleopolyhedrovirus]|uniref:Uncharacterized protein n=1 Tax=Orgyia leucostigma nucleopolyhedrovirus TaxID=490711 RepID=B0FDX2_9ABAC|nr:hypothetical protein [Orgyia leucostigma nucleopolyhedrovirus]ABY65830.1 hypothetical protein [Orgyia leucostigma nucleopolyhedrovirus]